jgi:hypothetical protein
VVSRISLVDCHTEVATDKVREGESHATNDRTGVRAGPQRGRVSRTRRTPVHGSTGRTQRSMDSVASRPERCSRAPRARLAGAGRTHWRVNGPARRRTPPHHRRPPYAQLRTKFSSRAVAKISSISSRRNHFHLHMLTALHDGRSSPAKLVPVHAAVAVSSVRTAYRRAGAPHTASSSKNFGK